METIIDPVESFQQEVKTRIHNNQLNKELQQASNNFMLASMPAKYSYNFSWLGRPVIQYPQDLVAMQELIWRIKPDLIVETGIAHGGSVIFYASLLELVGHGSVLGIDIDLREHNAKAIAEHPLKKRIQLLNGSSVAQSTIEQVQQIVNHHGVVMVCLDANHTYAHVLQELNLYAPLVTNGSYLVVFDTIIEDMPDNLFYDRPWGRGNNPKAAVREFLRQQSAFIIDEEVQNKLLITAAPSGYLKRIK